MLQDNFGHDAMYYASDMGMDDAVSMIGNARYVHSTWMIVFEKVLPSCAVIPVVSMLCNALFPNSKSSSRAY